MKEIYSKALGGMVFLMALAICFRMIVEMLWPLWPLFLTVALLAVIYLLIFRRRW